MPFSFTLPIQEITEHWLLTKRSFFFLNYYLSDTLEDQIASSHFISTQASKMKCTALANQYVYAHMQSVGNNS
jgi:hypothetical protein